MANHSSNIIGVKPLNNHVVIPIYSDIHGRIETLFKALSQLQNAQKTQHHTVLITGDLGWFPYPSDLPPNLQKLEIKSENDLGFSKFIQQASLRQRYFEDARDPLKLTAKFYFLRGNHEDHELLKDREKSGLAIIPADPSNTFNYLADGKILTLQTPDGHNLNIASFGGVHAETRPGRTIDNPLMTFDQKALDHLLAVASETPIDILLTHQGPSETLGGHEEVNTLIEILNPKIHVHGHSGIAQRNVSSYCVPDLDQPTAHALALDWNIEYIRWIGQNYSALRFYRA